MARGAKHHSANSLLSVAINLLWVPGVPRVQIMLNRAMEQNHGARMEWLAIKQDDDDETTATAAMPSGFHCRTTRPGSQRIGERVTTSERRSAHQRRWNQDQLGIEPVA